VHGARSAPGNNPGDAWRAADGSPITLAIYGNSAINRDIHPVQSVTLAIYGASAIKPDGYLIGHPSRFMAVSP
jgi:hypothetical protein